MGGDRDRSPTPSKAGSTVSQAAAADAASSIGAELEEDGEDDISLDEEQEDRWFEDLRASPLLAETLAGLPRAFVAYAEDDLLAVDATRFVDRLRADRGRHEAAHTLHLQGPLGHGFVKLPMRPEAHSAISAAAAFASAMLHAPPAA